MPKVSICVPTYNNPEDVDRLLKSVCEQTYKDIEVLISDDSTDGRVEEVVRRYDSASPWDLNIHYVHNSKPLGHIYNWNAAINMSSGEYIKIMFSDDWFTFSDSLSKLVGLLEDDPDADLAFSGSRQVILDENEADNLRHLGEKNKRKAYDRAPEEGYVNKLKNDFRYLFVSNQIGAPSDAIYRRGDKAALFDEKSNWASDVFLFMDILVKNPKFNSTTEPLISIGIHSGQYTEGFDEKDERVYNDYRYMYEKYGLSHSSMCRRHMAKEYVIKWHKGYAEADSLGIGRGLYTAMCLRELVLTVKSFVLSRLRRIAKGNTAS